MKTDWSYSQEDGLDLRTCPICMSTQVKTKDGDWAVYLTAERIDRCMLYYMSGKKETCVHTPDEE